MSQTRVEYLAGTPYEVTLAHESLVVLAESVDDALVAVDIALRQRRAGTRADVVGVRRIGAQTMRVLPES